MGDHRSAAASSADFEQTLRFEHAQTLAQSRTRDPEVGGQLVLGWQPVTGEEFSADDALAERLGDQLVRLFRCLLDCVHGDHQNESTVFG